MARFRTSGRNWEGREWYLAPSLVVLARQIEALHPDPKPGDGTVASKAHDQNSPSSDHRPRPFTGRGIVRAIDVGEDRNADPMVTALANSRDPRIAYIIYEGEAIRSYDRPGQPAWTWQDYTGPAPHSHHFHLSTLRTSTADNDTRPWTIVEDDMVDRQTKADDGNPSLADNFDEAVELGIYSEHTQPGGVAFNDEFATFLKRAGVFDIADLKRRIRALENQSGSGGLTEAQVKALINDSQIIAP